MKLLEGKVAVISGGASGMGASHARAIVAHGGQVARPQSIDQADIWKIGCAKREYSALHNPEGQ